jgi:hypothetical protein
MSVWSSATRIEAGGMADCLVAAPRPYSDVIFL